MRHLLDRAAPGCSGILLPKLVFRGRPFADPTDGILPADPTRLVVSARPIAHLGLEEVTLAEAFRGAGYATFFAGKWHLGAGAFGPEAQGLGPGLKGANQFYYPAGAAPDPKSADDPKTTDTIADSATRFILA